MENVGVETIHEATTIVDAFRAFYRRRPAIVVADLTVGEQGVSGLSLIRRIRTLEARTGILAFSMHDDPTIVARAPKSGATGYVLEDAPAREFPDAFDAVRRGRSYLHYDMALRVAMLNASAQHSPLSHLTEREFQVLSLLKDGLSYQANVDALAMKHKTLVNTYSPIRRKLGVRTLADPIHATLQIRGRG